MCFVKKTKTSPQCSLLTTANHCGDKSKGKYTMYHDYIPLVLLSFQCLPQGSIDSIVFVETLSGVSPCFSQNYLLFLCLSIHVCSDQIPSPLTSPLWQIQQLLKCKVLVGKHACMYVQCSVLSIFKNVKIHFFLCI